jgi:hypothetical protein
MLLHGAHPEETNARRGLDHLGDDPVAAFAALADEMGNAFREPSALDRTVHHPAGDRSGRTLLEMRIMDFTLIGPLPCALEPTARRCAPRDPPASLDRALARDLRQPMPGMPSRTLT